MIDSNHLVPMLITLNTDLGLNDKIHSADCIDTLVDKDYPNLKQLVRETVVRDGKLDPDWASRIEGIGMQVVLDKTTAALSVYLINGHFTVT